MTFHSHYFFQESQVTWKKYIKRELKKCSTIEYLKFMNIVIKEISKSLKLFFNL